jgi:hypothetical protein
LQNVNAFDVNKTIKRIQTNPLCNAQ